MGEQESMREQFEAAWDKSEEDNTPEVPETAASPEVVAEASEPTPIREEQQEEMFDKPAEEPEKKSDEPNTDPAAPKAAADKAPEKPKEKAPASWSPANREQWGKLPDAVKAQVAKREQEIDLALKKTADARKVADQLFRTMQPYQQSMMAAGFNDPFAAISSVMQTEQKLRSGTSYEKANTIVQLMQQYGVDVQTLDNVLSGQPQQAGQQAGNPDLENLLNQRLAPINQYVQQMQQREQMQQQLEAQRNQQTVASFQPEFIADVRMDMADLIDLAMKRGVDMPLQEAYDRACAMHPEISKILEQRKQQQALMGTTQEAQRKKAAASASLTGRQAGQVAPDANLSLRDTIQNAWNEQTG